MLVLLFILLLSGNAWGQILGPGMLGGGSLSGSGTLGSIAKWTAATELGDSIMTEVKTTINVAGNVNISGLTASKCVETDSSKNLVSSTGGCGSVVALQGGFDGGGGVIVNNSITYARVPSACTVTGWSVVVDTGTITIDVFKIANSVGGALPTASITGSATPAISSGNQTYSTTLTGWTTSVAALDVIAFKVTAVASATKASIAVLCTKT